MIRRPPRSTQGVSSAASDVYKRQIVVGVAEVVVTSAPNVLDAVVAVVAARADPRVRFRAFHDTATCRLGTMRSQASFPPTSKATVVDQEVARAGDVVGRVPVEVEVETLAPEITPVPTEVEETTQVQVEAETTTLDLAEVEATTPVLTEVETQVRAAETPDAIAAKERLEIRAQQG